MIATGIITIAILGAAIAAAIAIGRTITATSRRQDHEPDEHQTTYLSRGN